MASETAAEIDHLHKLVAKLAKRLEKIERKPVADLASMQNTVARLDATCSQLQNTMMKYFEASSRAGSGGGEIIDLPARRN